MIICDLCLFVFIDRTTPDEEELYFSGALQSDEEERKWTDFRHYEVFKADSVNFWQPL